MDNLTTPEEVCPLGFTEKSDFSIFLRYPDIDFDPETGNMDGPGPAIELSLPVHGAFEEGPSLTIRFPSPVQKAVEHGPGPTLHFSSPASDIRRCDETDSASRSNSTPYTTPRRLETAEETIRPADEYQDYIHALQAADLPETAIHYYRCLADQILQIGVHFQPKTLYLSSTTTQDVIRDSSFLLNQLEQSVKVVSDHTSAIIRISSLAPFTLTPTDLALYSIFIQRCSLIIANLCLPSPSEHRLLSDLLPVFDGHIYSPYLHLPRDQLHSRCIQRINDLYHALNTLISSYSTWLRAMACLKSEYISPLLRRIADSSWVQTEITQIEDALEACNRMNTRPISEIMSYQLGEEQVKGAEKLVERRRTKSSMAVKDCRRVMVKSQTRTRVRREYTL